MKGEKRDSEPKNIGLFSTIFVSEIQIRKKLVKCRMQFFWQVVCGFIIN